MLRPMIYAFFVSLALTTCMSQYTTYNTDIIIGEIYIKDKPSIFWISKEGLKLGILHMMNFPARISPIVTGWFVDPEKTEVYQQSVVTEEAIQKREVKLLQISQTPLISICKHIAIFAIWFLLLSIFIIVVFLIKKLLRNQKALDENSQNRLVQESQSSGVSPELKDYSSSSPIEQDLKEPFHEVPAEVSCTQKNKKGRNRFIIPVVTFFISPIVIFFAIQIGFQLGTKSKYKNGNCTDNLPVLSAISDKINKALPMAVDRSTRCDSVSPGPKGLIVNYTITNQDMYQIPPEVFKESAFDLSKNSICSDPSFSPVFKLGLGIEFKYWKNDGTFFFSFVIIPSDCSD